ncbi:hypothetical protein LCGC14_1076380, partial [marine sediment metagenome]
MATRISLNPTIKLDSKSVSENKQNSPLYNLPNEVLLNIIQFLPYDNYLTQSLVNFADVCGFFKILVGDYIGNNIPLNNYREVVTDPADPMLLIIPPSYFF